MSASVYIHNHSSLSLSLVIEWGARLLSKQQRRCFRGTRIKGMIVMTMAGAADGITRVRFALTIHF